MVFDDIPTPTDALEIVRLSGRGDRVGPIC
jgi:hypothetical protein